MTILKVNPNSDPHFLFLCEHRACWPGIKPESERVYVLSKNTKLEDV